MMTARQIRQTFLDFFKEKGHEIVPSAPLVIKNDPTLMFTNAGMNQFKDYFLGNRQAPYPRAADTQKCLRVSGKHNDLEDVGIDTYHHTMFEMLGNWSFGDYFKKEAIEWCWQLLTERYGLDKERLYVTVFGGDEKDGLPRDEEAAEIWAQFLPKERILYFSKKDNFWEMGDTGPCGPCTEVHIDLRDASDRKAVNGADLVNQDNPRVIEIWNNVFMEFNRLSTGTLLKLPAQHVDTGMGFERLCVAIQGKRSNYDTDVFSPLITFVEELSGVKYGSSEKTDIAIRVVVDHIRAISFAIADGQLPGNAKAGYVIRRILRRAVRYGYQFLGLKQPFMSKLVYVLAEQFDGVFQELTDQKDFVSKVIHEEEQSFLRTLDNGLGRIDNLMAAAKDKVINGKDAFELYDTYGFPFDLTALIARENGYSVDSNGFDAEMATQKDRSRAAAKQDAGDWVMVQEDEESKFYGYDTLSTEATVLKYRTVSQGKTSICQIVLDKTPFYGESGGQIGDTGTLTFGEHKLCILDTKKENDLILHIADNAAAIKFLTAVGENTILAEVNSSRRTAIASNHSATHLLHSALRNTLGDHVAQKGSLVSDELLRFDFTHFGKITDEELAVIENEVNAKIRENIELEELRNIPIDHAKNMGATALFGEKYGDTVRIIAFDREYSMELCGGTHVPNTGVIGYFKLVSESSVAAGVRRVEAHTSEKAVEWVRKNEQELSQIKEAMNNPADALKSLKTLMDEKQKLEKLIEHYENVEVNRIKQSLINSSTVKNGIKVVLAEVPLQKAELVKNLSFELRKDLDNAFIFLAAETEGKPHLSLMVSDNLVESKKFNASAAIRDLAKHIQGGGGGQPFYATAGGKNPEGIKAAMKAAEVLAESL